MNAVSHPRHYNSHPSGIECKDIMMHLSTGTQSAVKYVWRRDDKHESPVQDIKKAIQWLKFEVLEYDPKKTKGFIRHACHSYARNGLVKNLSIVIKHEQDTLIRHFYQSVLCVVLSKNDGGIVGYLEDCIWSLQKYLEGIEDGSTGNVSQVKHAS